MDALKPTPYIEDDTMPDGHKLYVRVGTSIINSLKEFGEKKVRVSITWPKRISLLDWEKFGLFLY